MENNIEMRPKVSRSQENIEIELVDHSKENSFAGETIVFSDQEVVLSDVEVSFKE